MQFDFLNNSFTTFENIESPKIILESPLADSPLDISDWAQSINNLGIPIVKNNLKFKMNNNNTQEYTPQPNQQIQKQLSQKDFKVKSTKESEALSKIIDEVATESGYEELKDPNIKKSLMLQAQRESGFNSGARSSTSTASGYFQFIDGTRKKYNNISREQFLNNPKEQVRTAYKYYKDIHNSREARELKNKGYNDYLITALGWWYPRSMRMILNGETNFTLGGYSIKQALQDYG